MSNTTVRLLTAAVAVPVLLLLFYLGGAPFVLLIEAVLVLAVNEYGKMAAKRGLAFQPVMATIGVLTLGVVAATSRLDLLALSLTVAALVILVNQLRRSDLSTALSGSATTIFALVYLGWLLAHAVLLRFPPARLQTPGLDLGLFFIVLAIAGVFLADAGAYFVGRAWGKTKIYPLISPGKSWEGALGGAVAGILGLALVKLVFDRWIFPDPGTRMPLYHCLILGPILVPASIAGDFFESMLKRDAGVKDSGTVVPGHGGIMDRLDSILFALPVVYYYLRLVVYRGTW
jgi:phosphatidate cytidylyltransferase